MSVLNSRGIVNVKEKKLNFSFGQHFIYFCHHTESVAMIILLLKLRPTGYGKSEILVTIIQLSKQEIYIF